VPLLSDVCQVFSGVPARDKAGQVALPVVGSRALQAGSVNAEHLDTLTSKTTPSPDRMLMADDVLILVRGNPKAAVVPQGFPKGVYASGNIAVLRPHSVLDGSYLRAFLEYATNRQLVVRRKTTTLPVILIHDLRALELKVPSLSVQLAITQAATALRSSINAQKAVFEATERTYASFLQEVMA
jgi:hypothetical protein